MFTNFEFDGVTCLVTFGLKFHEFGYGWINLNFPLRTEFAYLIHQVAFAM